MKNICSNPTFLFSIEHPLEMQSRRVAMVLIGGVILLYVYCVGASILNVMAQTEAETHARALRDTIAILESRYFSLSQTITPEAGAVLGLIPTDASYVRSMSDTAYVR